MEPMDQISLDQALAAANRPWRSFSEVEQAALLVHLSESLHRRLDQHEIAESQRRAAQALADAAERAGEALRRKADLPFMPDPPMRWDNLSERELQSRLPEITTWASSTTVTCEAPPEVRQAARELAEAGHAMQHELERGREAGRERRRA